MYYFEKKKSNRRQLLLKDCKQISIDKKLMIKIFITQYYTLSINVCTRRLDYK